MKSILPILMVSLCGCSQLLSFEEKLGKPPVNNMNVTRYSGTAHEIFIRLDPSVRLEDSIDLSVFGAFRPGLDLDSATQAYGQPDRRQYDIRYRMYVSIWDLTNSSVGLISVPGSFPPPQWQLRAYPHSDKLTAVFLNDALLEQVVKILPENKTLDVHIAAEADKGHVTLFMNQTSVTYMSLSRWGKHTIFKQ